MRVALVHEFLTQLGGAERVLQAFHEIFPKAPVFTLVYDELATEGVFASYDIRPSFLNKLPFRGKNYKWFLPLMTSAIESFKLTSYDLVLSDSSAFAKGVKTFPPTLHISYCHTPTRYLWFNMDEYLKSLPYSGLIKWPIKPYLQYYLRGWDYAAAQRPDYLIANSRTVKERIKSYYNRDSVVIYPPVDTQFFKPTSNKLTPKTYYLAASRLEPYKRIDLVVQAFNKLNLPLKVAGYGTQFPWLRKLAKQNIEFLGHVTDAELKELYTGAKAFVFPALEDAGIMVLEALACGTSVIGLNRGGSAEFIKDGENGALMSDQSADAVSAAVKRLENMKFDAKKLREFAQQHDKEIFKKKILEFIEESLP